MDYRELKYKDLPAACELVGSVFSEFVAPDCSDEGVRSFMKFIQPEELKRLIDGGKLIIMGCFDGVALAGVIAVLDYSHLSLFFVDKAYHCRGIAKELLTQSLRYCMIEKPELDFVTVNSSLYAVDVYERLGFTATGGQKTVDGITFVPMRRLLNASPACDGALVRHIKSSELPDLLTLYRQLNPDDPDLEEDEYRMVFNDILNDPGQHCLVAEAAGQIVASCTLIIVKNLTRGGRPYGLVENVITHEKHRRRGLGSMLMQKALDIARHKDCYKVMLLSGRGEEAIRFYEKAGFQTGKKKGMIVRFDGL